MVASKAEVSNLSSYGVARSTIPGAPLSEDEARKTHAFWRACNYLALGLIYLQDNPLLREPLKPRHIKNRMLGNWGPVLRSHLYIPTSVGSSKSSTSS